jgi:hypothetical protein
VPNAFKPNTLTCFVKNAKISNSINISSILESQLHEIEKIVKITLHVIFIGYASILNI